MAAFVTNRRAGTDEGGVALLIELGIPLSDDAVAGVVFGSDTALAVYVEIKARPGTILVVVEGVRREGVCVGGTLLCLTRTNAHAVLVADEWAGKMEVGVGGALLFLGRTRDHADVLFVGIDEAPEVVLRIPLFLWRLRCGCAAPEAIDIGFFAVIGVALLFFGLRHVEASILVADERT